MSVRNLIEPLPPDHYLVHVSYAQVRGREALAEKFVAEGPYSHTFWTVSSLFDGRPWVRHCSCDEIDETPGEREFRVAEIPAELGIAKMSNQFLKRIDTNWKALAAHFDRDGYRFAIETEAIAFADAQPDLQRKNTILALGSFAFSEDWGRCVTALVGDHRGRSLGVCHVGCSLSIPIFRLLLVRK